MGSSSYRKEIFPEYKGNREEKFKDQTEAEREEFKRFIEDFEKAMELCAKVYPVIGYKKVEADDIITIISNEFSQHDHMWILSTDKDLDQLVSDRVSRFSYYTRKEVRLDNFMETYGCSPKEYISMKVLMGDAGDNVPGVKLVGEKRAVGLIRQYGSAMDIYDCLPLNGKQKVIANINEFGDQILTNYELMDLEFSPEALGEYYNHLLDFIDKEKL